MFNLAWQYPQLNFFWYLLVYCVVPENTHTSPTEEIFSNTPTPLEIQIKLHTFFKFFGPIEPPTPQETPIPSVQEYGYFMDHDIDI